MAYNLVTDLYTAHAATPMEAEVDDIAAAIAAMIAAVFAPLPLSTALAGTSGAAVTLPPKVPWGVVLPDPQGGQVSIPESNQLQTAVWHRYKLVFLFGPPVPVDTLVTAHLDYLYAAQLAVSENRHLDGRVHTLRCPAWAWGEMPYAGKPWGGLALDLEAKAIYGMRAAW